MTNNNTRLGVTLAFASLSLLGIMPIISNSRPLEISALNFALYLSLWQLIIALPVFFIELKLGGRGIFNAVLPAKVKKRTLGIILITGVMFGLATYAYVLSLEKAGTVSAAIAMQAYPLFAILWESIFLKRKKSKAELFFTFLLIISLYYLGTAGSWRIEGISAWFLFALSVPFIWSVAHVIIKEVLNKTPITPVQVTFFRVLVSSIILGLISMIVDGPNHVLSIIGNAEFQTFAAVMGLVYYLELIIWFYAVKHINVSLASSITTPWPALTMLFASYILLESIESYQLITMLVISASIYGLLLSGKK